MQLKIFCSECVFKCAKMKCLIACHNLEFLLVVIVLIMTREHSVVNFECLVLLQASLLRMNYLDSVYPKDRLEGLGENFSESLNQRNVGIWLQYLRG